MDDDDIREPSAARIVAEIVDDRRLSDMPLDDSAHCRLALGRID